MRSGAIDGLRNRRGDLSDDVVLPWERGMPRADDKLLIGNLCGILDDDSPGVPYLPNV